VELVHFTRDNDFKLGLEPWTYEQRRGDKPVGLWLSDEADYGWDEWCKSNLECSAGKYAYTVELAPEAHVLHLATDTAVANFAASFKEPFPHSDYFYWINWPRVVKLWQGILITPYQWSLRLHPDFFWYYGWDCASGCIWDVSVIQTIKEWNGRNREG
jgi:hypothetical protein